MEILKSLSKKDSYWRKVAYKITGNKSDSDELVQEMYLRMYKYNPEIWNYSYIILVMYNLFKDGKKAIRYTDEINDNTLESVTNDEKISFSDRDLEVLKEIDKLTDEEKKLISLNYDLSSGKIAKNLEQCRIKTHRDLIKIRRKVLKDTFCIEYNNRRLKYKNGK